MILCICSAVPLYMPSILFAADRFIQQSGVLYHYWPPVGSYFDSPSSSDTGTLPREVESPRPYGR